MDDIVNFSSDLVKLCKSLFMPFLLRNKTTKTTISTNSDNLGAGDLYHNDFLYYMEFDAYRTFINITTFNLCSIFVSKFCCFHFSVGGKKPWPQ